MGTGGSAAGLRRGNYIWWRARGKCEGEKRSGLPAVAHSQTGAHLRQGYGGQPSRAFMSEGWTNKSAPTSV